MEILNLINSLENLPVLGQILFTGIIVCLVLNSVMLMFSICDKEFCS
jgi:hypothetical protein